MRVAPVEPTNPTPTPTPEPTPPYTEACQALLDQGLPWCNEVVPPMTCGDCIHNPTTDPRACEKAAPCPPELPEPQCPKFTDRGGTERCQSDACDCYCDLELIECPDPPDPPPPGECTLGTPTATELFAQGRRVEIQPKKEGRASVSATPTAAFGREYYCTAEMNWPEACAAGRNFGPVAPDGHPERLACERQFLQQNCPTFVMAECVGTGNWCPITFDPWYVIGGVNQNHPRNVEAGCNGADWVRDEGGGIVQGMFWLATAHGKGYIQACNKGKVVCTKAKFLTDW